MNHATFRFYEELNDFLPEDQQKRDSIYSFKGKPSIKDVIEAHNVPHTEVDLILANGKSVGFGYHLKDGDRIAVYPIFESFNISPMVKLRERPLRDPKFVLDVHLGKLARLMRLMGFDTYYRNDLDDPEIVQISTGQKRVVLTRDKKLLHARAITHGCWLRSVHAEEQLREVIRRFNLENHIDPFKRCQSCNGPMKKVEKADILDQLEPLTRKHYDEFYQCSDCRKIYWQGSHFEDLKGVIEKLVGSIGKEL